MECLNLIQNQIKDIIVLEKLTHLEKLLFLKNSISKKDKERLDEIFPNKRLDYSPMF